MATKDFSITFHSEDQEFAFEESRYIRKMLQEEDLESVSIKQQRKDLEGDEAGGLLLAGIIASVSVGTVGSALGAVGSIASILDLILNVYHLRRNKKNQKLDKKPLEIHLESPSGAKLSIDIDSLKEKEDILELVSSLKAIMAEE